MESFRPSRGVTLIELLVVLGIIGVLAALITVSQSSFNKSLILANTAYDVALTVRSTQTLGLGSGSAGYGIHVSKGVKNSFLLFSDTVPTLGAGSTGFLCHPVAPGADPSGPSARPGDCVYTAGAGGDAVIRSYTIGNGITIKDFCAQQAGIWTCANTHTNALNALDIVFSRPSAEAFITTNGRRWISNANITAACISFQSPQGGTRAVAVSRSGEITGNSASCPSS